jgi:hypothetical protein
VSEGAAQLGVVATSADANVPATGLAATGVVGDVFVAFGIVVQVTGLQSSASVGIVVATAAADVQVSGLAATGVTGPVNVWGEIDDNQTPNWTPIASAENPSWVGVPETQNPDWQDVAA